MYLLSSDVQHNGDFVARLEGIADPKLQWMNDRNARLDFENDAIKFSLNMSLATAKDIHGARLLLGVGNGIDFSTIDGWKVTMLPQTWAALVQKNADGFLVAIPEPFPIRRGKVPLDVKLADGLPSCKLKEENKTEDNRGILIPDTSAWCPNQSIIESTVRSLCKEKKFEYESKRVYMKPDIKSPSFDPNKGSIETCAIAEAKGNFVEIIA
ncbi:MAG: hypothetical protein NT027_07975, partial [Proteobacteria bacterium]|nr:hypothetical protein [Pseudomonadota bacterium]